jgi:ribosomal protein L37E
MTTFIIVIILIAAIMGWVLTGSLDAQYANWDTYAVCRCGYRTRAPFGSLFHVHTEVCPECGEDKNNAMRVRTSRFINGAWEDK